MFRLLKLLNELQPKSKQLMTVQVVKYKIKDSEEE